MFSLGLDIPSLACRGRSWEPIAGLGASLVALWDAERTDLLSLSGANVTSWTDSKSGYIQTQATSGFKPLLDPVGVNGRPAIAFDETDDLLRGSPAAVPGPVPTGNFPSELWLLINQRQLAANTSSYELMAYGSASATAVRRLRRVVVSGVNRLDAGVGDGSVTTSVTDSTVDFSGVHVVRLAVGSSTMTLYIDGVQVGTAAAVPNTANTRIGFGGTAGQGCSVNIGAITQPLDVNQAAKFTQYLKARGGIA